MEKDSQISLKLSSVKHSESIGEEQEIKISVEIDGILKQSSLIFTGNVSFNFPNFGILCKPII